MSTFFGGLQLVELFRIKYNGTPTPQVELAIKTIPSGHHGILKFASLSTQGQWTNIYHRQLDVAVQDLNGPTNLDHEQLIVNGGVTANNPSTITNRPYDGGNVELKLFEGDSIFLDNKDSGTNAWVAAFTVIIEIYKNP